MYRKTVILVVLLLSTLSLDVLAGVKPNKHIIKHNHSSVVKKTEYKKTNTSLECLAKTIYYEARGESAEGKKWVAHSVVNRTRHPKFPKDVCSVISEKHNGVCQFSWWCSKSKIKQGSSWETSVMVASEALSNPVTNSRMDNALFFHAVSTRPSWSRKYKKIGKVDHHVFYGES